MEKLELYNNLRQCPDNAISEIKAGKLKGKSNINPQWRIEKLTETFGPCGFGWYTEIKEHWNTEANGESCAWVRIHLFVKYNGEWSQAIEGVGGSKNFGKGKGASMDDEAFKMAETDAISVACKKLGIAADIYWQTDRTKYDVKPEQDIIISLPLLKKGTDDWTRIIDWLQGPQGSIAGLKMTYRLRPEDEQDLINITGKTQ